MIPWFNFYERITLSIRIETTASKVFSTFMPVHSLFKRQRLRTNIKLTLHKAVINFIMSHVCPAWTCVSDTSPHNWYFPRRTLTPELHVAIETPYLFKRVSKLRTQKAEINQITKMQMLPILEKAKPCI